MSSPSSPTWLDSAAATWDAPPLSQQIAEDKEKLQMGMGAIFIPRMTDAEMEPDVEILDKSGEPVTRGKPGRKYSLMPGSYYVLLGSGAHRQKIVKKVEVEEGKILPLIPQWSGIEINVVDENNQPFRGEYELVRIDEFEPYGRGYGRDPDLGQELQAWVLRPGLYKIFGVGQSYNTLKNFVTVRLLPGEFLRYVVVQKSETDMTIIGGGVVELETRRELASNWKYGIDIGGGADFNTEIHHDEDSAETSTDFDLLMNALLRYQLNKVDWETRLRLVESIRLKGFNVKDLESSIDELRLSSIYTWRVVKWLGPYGRLETETEIFPDYTRRPDTDTSYYFILTDENDTLTAIDSITASIKLEPAFTPFSFEVGAGANVRLPHTSWFEAKFLGGIGFRQRWSWEQSVVADTAYGVPGSELGSVYMHIDSTTGTNDRIIIRQYPNTSTQPEYGPEAAFYGTVRLGRIATADTEIKLFSPFSRFTSPDLYSRITLSWRIFRAVTLVYEFEYELNQPEEEALRDNFSTHRVLIRFSYTSR
jgi:hypothetical protein